MAWPIAEVARMSGVTARTLWHYDEIGQPAVVTAQGLQLAHVVGSPATPSDSAATTGWRSSRA